jgi:hypothetical protein
MVNVIVMSLASGVVLLAEDVGSYPARDREMDDGLEALGLYEILRPARQVSSMGIVMFCVVRSA